MEIRIRTLKGESIQIQVEADQTVGDLKKLLQHKDYWLSSSPHLHFHLFLRGSKLEATLPIRSLAFQAGDFLVVVPYTKEKKRKGFAISQLDESNQQCSEITGVGSCLQAQGLKTCMSNSSSSKFKDATEKVWESCAADLAAWQASSLLSDEGCADVDVTSKMYGVSEANNTNAASGLRFTASSKSIKEQSESNKSHKDSRFEQSTNRESRKIVTGHLENLAMAGTGLQDIVQSCNKTIEAWLCPPVFKRLNGAFMALNTGCGFLQKQHIQGSWQNMKGALQQICDFESETICIKDIENLALLFPQLVHIKFPDKERNEMLKIDMPWSRNDVMPIDLKKGTGPSHHFPDTGGKQISNEIVGSIIRKRQIAFQRAVDTLIKQLQDSLSSKSMLDSMLLDDIISAVKDFPKDNVKCDVGQGLSANLLRATRTYKKLKPCRDTKDLTVPEMILHLKKGLGSFSQIAHCETLKPREARYGQLAVSLSKITEAAIKKLGISKLYSHQTKAINAAVSKQSVVIATSTASGKSVCYNVPVLEELFANTESCALYVFPTKALAQDQLRALSSMTSELEPKIDIRIYDGDTPEHDRLIVRDHARILITNPDMLHVSILPSHKQFERVLSNLRYVVIDEAHAYRGAFGCHTAIIIRRLRRLCHHLYGTEPTFIISSATVANPREHVMELIGLRDIQVVKEDGSPCGEKLFVLWNPPIHASSQQTCSIQNNADSSSSLCNTQLQRVKRSSPLVEVSCLQAEMVQHNIRCICFCKTRKLSELVLNMTHDILRETAPDLVNTIRAYRAGYTRQDRRNIECDLFGGKLRAVVATNALELGVDVGNLDATLHLGFPGTVTSLWQQAGRAGRREKPSLSLYVAFESPLDQYFMKNPQKLFSRPIEHTQIDAYNHQVVEQHLACAAFEHPLHLHYDEEYFGSGLEAHILNLVKSGHLGRHASSCSQNKSWYYIGQEKRPSQCVSIRAIDCEKYKVINRATNEVIEEVEESRAFFEVYEGAVYLHQGKTYLVKVLDLTAKVALCQEADVKYYTKTRDFTDVHVIGAELAYPRKMLDCQYPTTTAQASKCQVTTRWFGFRRIWQGTNEVFDSVDLFLPDYSYESQAAWIRVPHPIREDLDAKKIPFRAGLHAASHALLNIVPLYIICHSTDIGTECANPHDSRYFPERLLIFDRHPGGIGITSHVRILFGELLQAALELITSCECNTDAGCPNCVQHLGCKEFNEVIHKHAAVTILQGIIEAEDRYRLSKEA